MPVLSTLIRNTLSHLQLFVHQHPRRITATVAAVLLSAGGGAFAVASLGPDPADIPTQTLIYPMQSLPLATTEALLEQPSFTLYRSDKSRSSDSAETLLQRLGIADPSAAAFFRKNTDVQQNLLGRSGRSITAETTENHRLTKLTARWVQDDSGNFKRLVVERKNDGFVSRIETAPLQSSTRLTSAIIQSSLFAATDDANIPDAIAIQIAEIFSGNIDFHRSLRKGDRFSVVYETLEADGEPLRSGRVLSTEFVNKGKAHQALWFQESHASKGAYYTLEGESMRRAYLTSPLEFSRISSGFGMRMHPIQQRWKAHLGTDYAATTGTPVRTIGDGVVEFAGVQNGFGNVIFVKHRNQQVTVYAHLSRIDVKQGQAVEQGQFIGAVGATGWATGPHLHFEFRVNGEHHDPQTMMAQNDGGQPIAASSRKTFNQLAQNMRIQLSSAQLIEQASAQ